LKDVDTVVIAKIDATANDVDSSLGIRGFPTIKFFPANNKNAPIDYEGDRTMEDMLSFIKQNASYVFLLLFISS
jgi:protein disulfide-isomerase A1